ncbi:MAG: DUF2252 domain-containing protein [Candidatus Accumulibacter phosphatis]|jgi:uncharacterized protein (DUF2252 family)|uniref:DUF2252 domain-containing protein n=2 Tax=Candidatus Accumulibacter TaxID=327159 RepID=A0A080MBV0_9PROT|nr:MULTISPECIES: DUF2252 domain-containing protein [Candidatus Accumulibacter]KFB74609.1 MAG: hypothetical protein AW09_000060 [Candidatus Accumulibacter phosphatis]NMQ05134.1 DUF2252 domain-containing protein [Candidatus Accumulibacter contiguus]HRF12714.1 DUF2252 domain-containing protein [Candidatus Accumulibacter phosphatis]
MVRSKFDDKQESAAGNGQAVVLSPQERRAQGSALRDLVSREAQGGWKPPKKRRDPIEVLTASNEGRMPELVPIRFGRMLQSPFTFYRGSAAIMAADLASTPNTGLRVQACGDAHLLNFGGFATPERQVVFDVNDLDETLPAPWEWDLKRLAASIVIAAQYLRLHENEATRAATATVRAYRERMADYSSMRALDVWYDTIPLDRVQAEMSGTSDKRRQLVARRIQKARQQSAVENVFLKLAEHHGALPKIKDNPPLVFHPSEEQAPGMQTQYREALDTYRASLPEHVRVLFDRFHLCDVAVKVVGVGSVGTQCLVALFMAADNDPLFLQIKEARASVLEPYAGASLHANHGQRVVAGQRLMQGASDMFLGWTAGVNGRHYYFRQLRDVKISAIVEGWDVDLLTIYGRLCARALARAHARSGDAALIAGYMGSSSIFDDAIGEFAVEYSDQNQRDYRAFVKAVREGRLEAQVEDNP